MGVSTDKSFPRVVQVFDNASNKWVRRVGIKSLPTGQILCWCGADTVEGSLSVTGIVLWKQWREIPDVELEYRPFVAEDFVKNPLALMGKLLRHKKDFHILAVCEIEQNAVGELLINGFSPEELFSDYEFFDGGVVGVKI